jgi:hypothetical protein
MHCHDAAHSLQESHEAGHLQKAKQKKRITEQRTVIIICVIVVIINVATVCCYCPLLVMSITVAVIIALQNKIACHLFRLS